MGTSHEQHQVLLLTPPPTSRWMGYMNVKKINMYVLTVHFLAGNLNAMCRIFFFFFGKHNIQTWPLLMGGTPSEAHANKK